MPNRIIHECILTSESIEKFTPEAEILLYRLLVIADDQGRFLANTAHVFSTAYPLRSGCLEDEEADDAAKKLADNLRQVADSLRQLVGEDVIKLYRVDGRQYGYFPNWKKYQR